nr:unnamed protein product [Digitaria exilis]
MEHNRSSSSSIFLDVASSTSQVDDGSEDGDRVLPHISRMLMEESIFDKFLYQYPDHPALVQAQQLFSHILSDASSSSDALAAQPCSNSPVEHSTVQPWTPAPELYVAQGHSIEDPVFVFNGTAMDAVEHTGSFKAESSSSNDFKDVVSLAFFKGMEEASKFLPSNGATARSGGRGQKKRLDGDDDEAVKAGSARSSKKMAADCEDMEEEEDAALEMLDQLMLNGCEPSPSVADMSSLRATMGLELEKTPRGRRRRGRNGVEQVVDLHAMLISCAEAMAGDDRHGVASLLDRIRRHSSPAGDATQRLAHYFAEGLEARLAGTWSRRRLLMARPPRGSSLVEHLKAFQVYMTTCCFLPVSFLFSLETICSAVARKKKKKLHIVSYGVGHGLQWPELLRRLGHMEGGPPEVRLTGVDLQLPGFRPAQLIEETGRRLSDCARQLGVPFKFRGIAARPEAVRAGDLDIDPDEVLVVDSLFHFRSLTDGEDDGTDNRANTIDTVLSAIREMRPAVFVHAVVNASRDAAFFTTRFREALHNFAALFDVMDAVLPRGDERRALFEREVLARCAMNAVACEGEDLLRRPRSYRQWAARSRRAGLRQLPLDRGVVRMVRDKVKGEYHRCFEIGEDREWLLQGWKGRVLYAHSTWTADDDLA